MSGGGGGRANAVFYAERYHPIQAGSIDGTDVLPHDNAVFRALLCSNANLYDPFGDPKVVGDPYRTVFVARLSRLTDHETLRQAMSKYGRVKNMRLVRDIVTGASRGYAFVEYESDREMRRAYEDAHHSIIDGSEVIVDYYRQHLMPGWIPRRLGGGLGGKKESGQLRFGGRERPFRAPLRPIPYDDLKRLGIAPPPEGRYMSRFQVPSPPRRRSSSHAEGEDSPSRARAKDREESYCKRRRSPSDVDENRSERHSRHREHSHDRDDSRRRSPSDVDENRSERHSRHREHSHDRDDSRRRHRGDHTEQSHRHKKRSRSRDFSSQSLGFDRS